MGQKGRRGAGIVLALAQTPNRFLSTVQIGITFVAILVGVFAGRNTADWMATLIQRVPVVGPYHNEIALGLVVLMITYLALVIGELVPKRLALRYPEKIAAALAIPLRLFTQVCAPMVGLLNLSTDAVCRLFGSQQPNEPAVTEEKSKCSCVKPPRQASSRSRSKNMFEAVLRFGDKSARSLMTPRTRITGSISNSRTNRFARKLFPPAIPVFPSAAAVSIWLPAWSTPKICWRTASRAMPSICARCSTSPYLCRAR